MAATDVKPLGWLGIVRLGLVQTALGAIVILTTSTLNRVMVVELMLPAMVPGILVGIHYAVQLSRPRWGYGSDMGGRRTPWIIGGMAVLALGGVTAALSVALMASNTVLGLIAATLSFVAIGVGVGASGTSLLTLLAVRVAPERRAPAATIVWVMMIVGFILTAAIAGGQLDPFSMTRLVVVTSIVSALAFALTLVAVVGLEGAPQSKPVVEPSVAAEAKPPFRQVIAEVWAEPKARNFSIFVFASMLAYSTQDLILEPFAGAVYGYTPGASTQLAGTQHGGVLLGMIVVALAGMGFKGRRFGSLQAWTVGGCVASGLALFALAVSSRFAEVWPLQANVFALGFANGAFAVAAIGSMMSLASEGGKNREGVRMGLWGAAQAIAFGLGGLVGTMGIDITRALTGSVTFSYTTVFTLEGIVFLISALLAARIGMNHVAEQRNRLSVAGDGYLSGVGGP
ncbi:MAG: BCD family MFS transporter [Rhizobiales bacterium]|nr:BCD family MFS transporter [Hyphomicrobiales bacterium]MBO6697272.1 BCD family MFS transporter [Hyphomicrobiales bacterium]MBO6736473.1 BCD family MFS transporter [Hyphomicrobiales bacterium]MBO6912943.1 BCD family MFS transporter [Hyphomicrobiales bacterium]MBO6954111.1 BCD family MFS transporter [Hyphomicrobiales bacterium]